MLQLRLVIFLMFKNKHSEKILFSFCRGKDIIRNKKNYFNVCFCNCCLVESKQFIFSVFLMCYELGYLSAHQKFL